MKIPSIGDVMEDAGGLRYRVMAVKLDDEPGRPLDPENLNRLGLYIALDPVKDPVPSMFRGDDEVEVSRLDDWEVT